MRIPKGNALLPKGKHPLGGEGAARGWVGSKGVRLG